VEPHVEAFRPLELDDAALLIDEIDGGLDAATIVGTAVLGLTTVAARPATTPSQLG
jgi:hypothetical protein